jgi:hypothetical protein
MSNPGSCTRTDPQPGPDISIWLQRLALIAAVTLGPSQTRAVTVDAMPPPPDSAEYAVYGHGRQPCSAYLRAREQALSGAYLEINYFRQWMAGYMSGYNLFRLGGNSSVAKQGDENLIESRLETYCRQRPEETFAAAAAAIVKQIHAQP